MRKKIAAGNWKMNNNLLETQGLINNILEKSPNIEPNPNPNLAEDRQDGVLLQSRDTGQVDADHTKKILSSGESERASTLGRPLLFREIATFRVVIEATEVALNLRIALGNLVVVQLKELDGLLQGEKVLFTPVPLERESDLPNAPAAAAVSQLGESPRVSPL